MEPFKGPSTTVAQFISAPERPVLQHATRLFLAGTTPVKPDDIADSCKSTAAQASVVDWRTVVRATVRDLPVTVLDPLRGDWDGSWKEDPSFLPFREQVEWELEMQDQATLTAFYFDPGREGAVSLLELGLCLGRKATKAVVGCPSGYVKRGNVLITCARYGVPVYDSPEALADAVREALVGLTGKPSRT